MLASFFLSGYIRGGIIHSGFIRGIYGNILVVLTLSIVLISYYGNGNKNIFKRGFYDELVHILRDQTKLGLILFAYMFIVQQGGEYSRIWLGLFFLFNILIDYVARSYLKLIMLLGYKKGSASNKVMLVTIYKNATQIIRNIRKEHEWQIYVNSITIWDRDCIGEKFDGIECVANKDNLLEMARLNVVDEVFIHIPRYIKIDLEELVLGFEQMGIVVHLNLDIFGNIQLKQKTINEFAGHSVVTFSTSLFDTRHAILKRLIDILGGLTGCILTFILTIFLAPAICIESRGPIFFSQTRVGKNGRRFKIYKFRSMYKDAEQRKKELMEKNEMQGLMFKMTDDPRITKVGKFIRKTSLDEFPQFFNVLIGEMSLVGTRPPTEDEFVQYEGHHKRRLSTKPGLTGLWQVSGRSDITNFEDVVKMDLEYIDNWSIGLDLKLIVKTVGVVLVGRGSK
jgi:exopolysaccharide biosynthesis polyprenyl glycosylphosphotransferase